MKEHTNLHPYNGTTVSLGYYYYDTVLDNLYINDKLL